MPTNARSQMNRVPLVLTLILLAFVCSPVPAQNPSDQDDVIRVETDLTNLFFTANGRDARFVTTLNAEDFRVTEDGVPQKILTFHRETDRPLSIAFLIDVSASQERTLSQEKAAARGFIETIIRSSKDQAAIIPFTGGSFLEQSLTRDVLRIYRALERVEVAAPAYLGSGRRISGISSGPGMPAPPSEGSTAIWEAIVLTAREVLGPIQDQRRRAIILLTDGHDTSSRVLRREAINHALAAETVIYAIGVGDKRYGIDRDAIRAVAEGTGGRAFFPKLDADLKTAFAEIEQELRSQYLIAYSSTNKNRDGSYRRMQIEITNRALQKDQLKLRHRPGYFAKSNQQPTR